MHQKETFSMAITLWLLVACNFVHASDFIILVSKDHQDSDIRELYSIVQHKYSPFFSQGKENNKPYKITDPAGKISPFLLSDQSAEKMTHEDAKKYCPGGRLATEAQLLALDRAINPAPNYKFAQNAITDISNNTFWGSVTNGAHPENAFYFSAFAKHNGDQMSVVSFFTSIGTHKAYVRCVLSIS
jgi:hypothetical protein